MTVMFNQAFVSDSWVHGPGKRHPFSGPLTNIAEANVATQHTRPLLQTSMCSAYAGSINSNHQTGKEDCKVP